MPPNEIKEGENISLDASVVLTERNIKNRHGGLGVYVTARISMDYPEFSLGRGSGSGRYFKDENGETEAQTSLIDGKQPTEVKRTLSSKFPKGNVGDKWSIYFSCYAGQVEWEYELKESKPASSDGIIKDDSIKDVPVLVKLNNQKGPYAKVTISNIKSGLKFQLRYKVEGSSKWKLTKPFTAKTIKIKGKSGKKIILQARLVNDSGDMLKVGAWSKPKKIKLDKK